MTDAAFNSLIYGWEQRGLGRRPEGVYSIIGYYKTRRLGMFDGPNSTGEDSIVELYYRPEYDVTIEKAEDIMNFLKSHSNYNVTLRDREYFVQDGSLFRDVFNPKKRKLLILSQQISTPTFPKKYVLFDKDIVINPEEPMNRFILRKLIPKMAAREMLFGFSDLDANLLQPSPPVDISSFDDIRGDIAQMCHDCFDYI